MNNANVLCIPETGLSQTSNHHPCPFEPWYVYPALLITAYFKYETAY